jgi:CheY-like chemotaxis protein
MSGKVECATLGLTTIDFLPEIQIPQLIACKKYDEKITTILMCKAYDDILSRERKSNGQKRIKRILVVDDEHDVNLTIRIVLEENGFKVDSFTDAFQALENFTAALYDLVILDVKLPGMDGFSLYEKIRKLDDKVVICFLTAADRTYYEMLRKQYPSINENCVIHKPVDNESLLRIIKSVL